MRRLRNIFIIIAVVFALVLVGNVNYHHVATDSGFDTGYDSGGSDWGGSDYGSSDWGSSSSSSSSSSDGEGISFFIFITILFIIIIVISVNSKKNGSQNNTRINNNTLQPTYDDTKIKKYIPNFNMEQFLRDRYGDFVNIQVSWMNFDYDRLRLKLTDELYNQYYMQLSSLEAQNRKNIMSNFTMNSASIVDFKCENSVATIKVKLSVSFYDYITENDIVVRGNKNRKVNMTYYLTFVSRLSGNATECPHCGAPLSSAASQTCPYCKCVISSISSDWVLTKKEVISQR